MDIIQNELTLDQQRSSPFLAALLDRCKNFELPGSIEDCLHIIPCSGGADSAVIAILLHLLFPKVQFILFYCDTGAEEPEIAVTLDKLEQFLNVKIQRLLPEKDLFQLIDHYNGFLPSPRDRYCTPMLKLNSFKAWLEQYNGRNKRMYVGIRADESHRLAFTIDEVETEMPFIDIGLRREDIFEILQYTIGIPKFYKRRTRSGCGVCIYQRRTELVGLYQEQPIMFAKGKSYERVNKEDLELHQEAVPLWKDTRIALNWLSLPLPGNKKIVGVIRRNSGNNLQMFNNRGIFVAAEFFMDGFLSNEEFIWHQRLVSYSTTLTGIKQQLDHRYQHLLGTAEVFDMVPDDVRIKAKFAIYYLEIDSDLFHPLPPQLEGYTWQKGASYAQLEHIVSICTRTLNAVALQEMASRQVRTEMSVEQEWKETAQLAIRDMKYPVGQVTQSEWYQPTEKIPEESEAEMLKTVPCPMCHI